MQRPDCPLPEGQIIIRFYEELNDFLPPPQRKVDVAHRLRESRSVKDLIESLGVPHTEVDLILVNGRSVDFRYLVENGDRISVYPVFESLDILPVTHLRPLPLRDVRFVLDTHLGRLAGYLRLLGFDVLYRNDFDDSTLAQISAGEHRTLLTCDRRLLMRKEVTHGYCVRERESRKQLLEVMKRLDLSGCLRPFTRCMRCNGTIRSVSKELILDQLQPATQAEHNEFWQCDGCRRVYWKGSHYRRMRQWIESLESEESQEKG